MSINDAALLCSACGGSGEVCNPGGPIDCRACDGSGRRTSKVPTVAITVEATRLGYRLNLPNVWTFGVQVNADEARELLDALLGAGVRATGSAQAEGPPRVAHDIDAVECTVNEIVAWVRRCATNNQSLADSSNDIRVKVPAERDARAMGWVADQLEARAWSTPGASEGQEIVLASLDEYEKHAERAAPKAPADPVSVINEMLCIGGAVLHVGKQLKCYVPDDEGGTSKTYLDADECSMLADAFAALAAKFTDARAGHSSCEERGTK